MVLSFNINITSSINFFCQLLTKSSENKMNLISLWVATFGCLFLLFFSVPRLTEPQIIHPLYALYLFKNIILLRYNSLPCGT